MRKISPLWFLMLCTVITGCCMGYNEGYGGGSYLRFMDLNIRLGDSLAKIYRVHYMSPINHTDTMSSRDFKVKEPVNTLEFTIVLFSDLGYDTAHFVKRKATIEIDRCYTDGNYEFFNLSVHTFDSVKGINLHRLDYYDDWSSGKPVSILTVY